MNNELDWNLADRTSVWHPFTQVSYAPENIIIEKGEGACFFDEEGNKYIDGISSWWVNLHGHCNKTITQAVVQQICQLEHSIFAGFTHKPGIELATTLLAMLPGFNKVFYSDNGSTAVEVAIKMAIQYWWNQGKPRTKIISFRDAYHGDTFGGMSIAARNAFNRAFEPMLFDVVAIDLPTSENIEALELYIEEQLKSGEVAAFIFEPLVLGAAGMLMYEPEHLDRLIAICRKYNCITIADEVMTGFGRTGRNFAIDHLQNRPDIICMSKGLTGGFFPLGATACRQFIFDAFVSSDKMKTFFHGHSYTGNPVTCAAAVASAMLLCEQGTQQRILEITRQQRLFAAELDNSSKVDKVRCTGTILAMNVNNNEETGYLNSLSDQLADFFIKRGIILRPLGNVLYFLPPYCITDTEMHQVYSAIREYVAK